MKHSRAGRKTIILKTNEGVRYKSGFESLTPYKDCCEVSLAINIKIKFKRKDRKQRNELNTVSGTIL